MDKCNNKYIWPTYNLRERNKDNFDLTESRSKKRSLNIRIHMEFIEFHEFD